jgi:hypothetical protein
MSIEALIKKALKLSLGVLRPPYCDAPLEDVIKAVEEALNHCEDNLDMVKQERPDGGIGGCATCGAAYADQVVKQEQGEPVGVAHLMQEGFTHCIWSEACVPVGTKFYTTPQQRKWVGLTAEEREQVQTESYGKVPHHVALIAAVEAKLKAKNFAEENT